MNSTATTAPQLCGLLLIDKPAGLTSHSVVARLRRTLQIDRVGHLGTLDPFATGLLPIMIGGATRLADEIMDGDKGYIFDLFLGQETDTLDPSGQTIATAEVPSQWQENLKSVLPQFTGSIIQVPPAYSALKMNGKPLYEHMRATGKLPADIATKTRNVDIHSIKVEALSSNTATLNVICAKGTYIRSLARDIAVALGTVGHCSALRRTLVAPWKVENALAFDIDNLNAGVLKSNILPPEAMVPQLPLKDLPREFTRPLCVGNVFQMERHVWPEAEAGFFLARIENHLFLSEITIGVAEVLTVRPRKKIS